MTKVKNINWSDYIIYIVFIGIFTFFAITLGDRGFLSEQNLMNIARQTAMIGIMAVGTTFVLSAAEIDLSFGSIVALSAIVTALTLKVTDNIFLGVLAGLGAGTIVGFINGFFVGYIKIPSFLVTLGMTGIVAGVSRNITSLRSVPIDNDAFAFIFGNGNIFNISILLIWLIIITIVGAVLLNKTTFGREVLATGGNMLSAIYSGIKVNKIKMQVLVLNGVLAAFAGILYAGRLEGARYTLGENDLMMVIAAVIIGGTSLFGGKGRILGSVIGALLMGMINNGLLLMALSVDHQMILRGIIIILAVVIMMKTSKD
jgi:ribose transport system permease protein